MVDLHGQYLKIKEEVNTAIQGVIDSSAFIRGGGCKAISGRIIPLSGCKTRYCMW